MKKIIIIAALMFTAVLVRAVPNMLNYRGKLFENGVAVNGTRTLRFQIFNQPTLGTSLWDSGNVGLDVNNGYYHFTFNGINMAHFTNDTLFLEVEVQGTGVLSPREQLVSVGYAFQAQNAKMVGGVSASNVVLWSRKGYDIFRMPGNVGIGTNNPVIKLHVLGGIQGEGNTSPYHITSRSLMGTGFGGFRIAGEPGNSAEYRFTMQNNMEKLFIANSGGDRMVIDALGNIGIGTNVPNAKLEIRGNLRLPATGSSGAGVIMADATRFIHNYGTGNSFLGLNAGNFTLTGLYNTGLGGLALYLLAGGGRNVAVGYGSLYNTATGSYSVGIGSYSGYYFNANYNTFVGYYAGYGNVSGSSGTYNAAFGYYAGRSLYAGIQNTVLGAYSGNNISAGSGNTLAGYAAGRNITSGNSNTIMGMQAGYNLTTGRGNVCIGYYAGFNETGSDKLYIDNSETSSPLIWGDFGLNYVNINGFLGIGTASPPSKLTVYEPASSVNVDIESDNGEAFVRLDGTMGHVGLQFLGNDIYQGGLVYNIAGDYVRLLSDASADIRVYNNSVVINEDSNDVDFRCEGADDANLLVVDAANNKVGIGLAIPQAKFQVYYNNAFDTGAYVFRATRQGSSKLSVYTNGGVAVGTLTTPPDDGLYVEGYSRLNGYVGIGMLPSSYQLQLSLNSAAKPTSSSWTISSDKRLKKNIKSIDRALDKMMKLQGILYQWKDPATQGNMKGTYMGMIAQDVERIFPEWVGKDTRGYKTITVIGFEALAVEAIRELKKDNEKARAEDRKKIAELSDQYAALNRKYQALEKKLENLAKGSK